MKLPLLLLALLLAVPSTALFCTPASAGMEEEADRQLGFARQELSQGNFDRAIASAESALRLNPAAYEAFLVKGLAYEQLGEVELASSLLVAYQEITKGQTQDPRAAEAVDRIRAARTRGPRRLGPARADKPDEPERVVVQPAPAGAVDIESYRARLKEAITAGNCAVAMATASELTMRAPQDPDGWRLSGDAGRCGGDTRAATIAYRQYQQLGGQDPRVGLLLEGLVQNLGTLEVAIERVDQGPVPLAALTLPWGEQLSPEEARGGALRFVDLPTGVALQLLVAGRGLDSVELEIAPLGAGEVRGLDVHPNYIGLGTVQIVRHDRSLCTTTLVSADGIAEVAPGGAERVTAGRVTAVVAGEHGDVDVPMDVPPNGQITFDPTHWVPSSLTIVDLPAGSEVRVFVDGLGDARLERNATAAPGGERLDAQTGVRLADPLLVRALIGGSGGIFVSHPVLGEGAGTIVLEPGNVNATTFAWRDMPGVSRVTERYGDWSLQRADLTRKVNGRAAAPVALAIGSAVASGVTLALAADAHRRVGETAASRDVDLNRAAVQQRSAFTVIGGVAAGVAVVGFVITGGVSARGKQELADFGEWDPISEASP